MRGPVTILLAVVLLAVAGWLVLSREEPGPGPEAGQAAAPADGGRAGSTAPVELPPDPLTVVLELRTVARLLPPPERPMVRASRAGGDARLPVELVAGLGAGRSGFRGAGQALGRVDLGSGRSLCRAVRVQADAEGEIELGPDALLRGRVVGPDGAPVAQARVWTGELHDGRPVEAATDADGRFEVVVPAGPGVPVTVRAAGLATAGRVVVARLQQPAEELFPLLPEAVLTVRCIGVAEALELGRVIVLPGDELSTEVLQHPFFLQTIEGLAAVGADGVATIRGLPAGAVLRIAVWHPFAAAAPATAVTLGRGGSVVDVPLATRSVLHGRLVDAAGAALPGVAVLARPAGREIVPDGEGRWLLPPDRAPAGCALAFTAADGHFAVGVPGDDGRVVITALRETGGAAWELPAGSDEPVTLVLPPWRSETPVLRVLPPGADPWLVEVRPLPAVPVAAGVAHEHALPAPGVLDVVMRVRQKGVLSPPQLVPSLIVAGTTDLATAGVPR